MAQTSANILTPLYETCFLHRFVAAAYVSPGFETLSINFGLITTYFPNETRPFAFGAPIRVLPAEIRWH